MGYSIEFFAILLVALIIPAYPVRIGMQAGKRLQLKASSLGEPMKTVESFVVASIVTLPFLFAYYSIFRLIWGADFSIGYFYNTSTDLEKFFIFMYCVAIYFIHLFLSYHFGSFYILAIERGYINNDMHHGIMYDLVRGSQKPVVYCSLFTKTIVDGQHIMYRGRLKNISFVSENKVDYVVLEDAFRYVFLSSSSQDGITIDDGERFYPVSYSKIKDASANIEIMYFDGSEIANILFSRTNIA